MRLRPVDLARPHGLSTQAIRNYEQTGILPPAARTHSGYRTYTSLHELALTAFLALIPAHGHPTATAIMQAATGHHTDELLRLIDDSHAQLQRDRDTLAAVEHALTGLDPAHPPPPGTGPTHIGDLAATLHLRPATLRTWENAGILQPQRDPATGYRHYTDADIRDAHLAHQLRRGGHPLAHIATLLHQIRAAGGLAPLHDTLTGWNTRLRTRGLAMLAAAGHLNTYLTTRQPHEPQ
ncbi:MerR family transcriptional regulator [Nonomuraea sp. NBC_01738]|uniref:MerR family transcriptional regulator n=1 Tax=Nonomuraea sp. NBC_01738 TaxID=2976003 RepID=UPI002E136365|nr:MerR family transcriptional regulator [Nonomuraea sp. NBC_01738]